MQRLYVKSSITIHLKLANCFSIVFSEKATELKKINLFETVKIKNDDQFRQAKFPRRSKTQIIKKSNHTKIIWHFRLRFISFLLFSRSRFLPNFRYDTRKKTSLTTKTIGVDWRSFLSFEMTLNYQKIVYKLQEAE